MIIFRLSDRKRGSVQRFCRFSVIFIVLKCVYGTARPGQTGIQYEEFQTLSSVLNFNNDLTSPEPVFMPSISAVRQCVSYV